MYDLALLWSEGLRNLIPARLARPDNNLAANVILTHETHFKRYIVARNTRRQGYPGACGSGFYQHGKLVGIVVGARREGPRDWPRTLFAVDLERILELD